MDGRGIPRKRVMATGSCAKHTLPREFPTLVPVSSFLPAKCLRIKFDSALPDLLVSTSIRKTSFHIMFMTEGKYQNAGVCPIQLR